MDKSNELPAKRSFQLFVLTALFSVLVLFGLGNKVQADELERPVTPNRTSAMAIDADSSQIIYQNDADKVKPVASLSKMMTVYLVEQQIDKQQLSWNDKIKVTPAEASVGTRVTSTRADLEAGHQYTVKDLVGASLVGSANDAAMVLGNRVGGDNVKFADMMNNSAREMGITDAKFNDACGLPNWENVKLQNPNAPKYAVNQASTRSMAIIAQKLLALDPKILQMTSQPEYTIKDQTTGESKVLTNTNKLVSGGEEEYPGLKIDGLKTGTTALYNGNLVATTKKDGSRIITVVMGSPQGQHFEDTVQLMSYVFNNFKTVKVDKNGFKNNVRSSNGVQEVLPVKLKNDVNLWIPKNNSEKQESTISIARERQSQSGGVIAPIKAEQPVGTLQFNDCDYLNKNSSTTVYAARSDRPAGFITQVRRATF
ncbi:serine hydrolase [Fructilactobacillus vespulae]|uniref:serine hydrolase n=1 Tax=Fructilactobacillus vespulae TaxID=1249630 RepID=UPI0039B6E6E7